MRSRRTPCPFAAARTLQGILIELSNTMTTSTTRDIVIIGGGHNGLITAFYLAKAGYKPLVLERSAQVGGAAVTDEFHPGFRCSTLAHAAGPLRADVVRDMELEKHGA